MASRWSASCNILVKARKGIYFHTLSLSLCVPLCLSLSLSLCVSLSLSVSLSLTHMQSRAMVLYCRAKLLCRISCVESAMRLPVLWRWMWRGVEKQGRKGSEAQTVLPAVVSGGHCGCCMYVAHRLRLSTKQHDQTEEAKEQFPSSSLFAPPPLFSAMTFIIIRLLDNHRVWDKMRVRYSEVWSEAGHFCC